MDGIEIKCEIIRRGLKVSAVSRELGWARQKLSERLNSHIAINPNEASEIMQAVCRLSGGVIKNLKEN